jgi:tRNA(adenine34) deaminase
MTFELTDIPQTDFHTNLKIVVEPFKDIFKKLNWAVSNLNYNILDNLAQEEKINFKDEVFYFSGEELYHLIERREIQFIWGLFSGSFEPQNQTVLKEIPEIDGNIEIWENPDGMLLKNSEIEIIAFDGTSTFVKFRDEKLPKHFKKYFPEAIQLTAKSHEPTAEDFMHEALIEAEKARSIGEVPIGAVIVFKNKIIGRGHNQIEKLQDPTAHAEVFAIKEAAEFLKNRRLSETTLYVTLEPCAMCAGAIVLARIPRLVFGTSDPKAGACGTLYSITEDARLNHRCEVVRDVLKDECAGILKSFFAELRAFKKKNL